MDSRRDRLTILLQDWPRLRTCGPSDDPDAQTAVTANHRHLLIQIQHLAAPILGDADAALLRSIEIEINDVYSVYNARAQMAALIPDIQEALESADEEAWSRAAGWIVSPSLIEQLRLGRPGGADASLLVAMCEEINSSFAAGNNIATVLLMRTVLNYVPPLFGQETFAQVVAGSGRSLKASFGVLEQGLRKVADFHTHRQIGKADRHPSSAQIEPFKPQFELLIQEVIGRSAPG